MSTTRYVWQVSSIDYTPGSSMYNRGSMGTVRTIQGNTVSIWRTFNGTIYAYKVPTSSISYAKLNETQTRYTVSSGTLVGSFKPPTSQIISGAYDYYVVDIGNAGSSNNNYAFMLSETQLSFPHTFDFETDSADDLFALDTSNRMPSGASTDNTLKLYAQYGNSADYTRLTHASMQTVSWADLVSSCSLLCYGFWPTKSAGTAQGYKSSSNSSAYPTNSDSGTSWYTKLGEDNIDPVSVSSPASPRGGQATLVTVTPSTGKLYSGTVSYRYEYSVNGGTSWVLANTTTATSLSIAIPEGSPSFQARVRAQDDLGFTSSTYVYSTRVTVINNEPPTAPGSISVGVPVGGQQVTITITAATDPDGQVVNYLYERSIDGNGWTQIASANALTYNDTVGTEWATVAYRVRAVDDDGEAGPYVTGETALVNSGWLFISGPAADMGDKPAPFAFSVSAGVSGSSGVTGIATTIALDGVEIYSNTVSDTDVVTLPMDTRLMGEGKHTISVAVSKDSYLPTSRAYVFTVPGFSLPDGGRMELLENPAGGAVFPVTLARAVIGYNGKSVEEIIENITVSSMFGAKLMYGTYQGSGTFGSNSPNMLSFAFAPRIVLLFDDLGAMTGIVPSIGKYSPRLSTGGAGTVFIAGTSVSWYASSAADQMNSSGKTYTYVAVG